MDAERKIGELLIAAVKHGDDFANFNRVLDHLEELAGEIDEDAYVTPSEGQAGQLKAQANRLYEACDILREFDGTVFCEGHPNREAVAETADEVPICEECLEGARKEAART